MAFLQETKVRASFFDSRKFSFEFSSCLVVDCDGQSGGLAILWKKEIQFGVLGFSKMLVHRRFGIGPSNPSEWYFKGFYDCPDLAGRRDFWALIRSLNPGEVCRGWWVGILTKFSRNGEKSGGRMKPEWQLDMFRETLDVCDMRDLGFLGCSFTWSNQREGQESIRERLGRFVASSCWLDLFPAGQVRHGMVAYFDHVPILLNTFGVPLSHFRGA